MGSTERIAVYAQDPSAEPPSGTSGALLALLFRGSSALELWPVPPYRFDELHLAWSILIDQCLRCSDRRSDADTNMAYAWYHCTTLANVKGLTYWHRASPE